MAPFSNSTWWRSRTGAVFLAAAAAAALYLAFVHIDHVLKFLPLLFILACPFMHLFMHHGRGGHGHGGHGHGDGGHGDGGHDNGGHGRDNQGGASDGKPRPENPGRDETPDKSA